MAELTPTNRYITVQGPIKIEILNFNGTISTDGDDQTGVDTGDTFISNLQNPQFAACILNADNVTSAAVSFSDRTGTITGSGVAADNVIILVFGF